MEKINVAEILRNCPRDMELNCTMYDNLYFNQICDDDSCLYKISCYTIVDGIRTTVNFTEFGTFNIHVNSKCLIFPKGKMTWEGFVPPHKFGDGDIIFTLCNSSNTWISIFKRNEDGKIITYVDYYSDPKDDRLDYCCVNSYCFSSLLCKEEDIVIQRLATEEEKQKILKAIEDEGYKWIPENKTLAKLIKPKFKVGDKIVNTLRRDGCSWKISQIEDNKYIFVDGSYIYIMNQDNWELAPGPDPNKFDINSLIPFESRVLVRDNDYDEWRGAFWGHLRQKADIKYDTLRGAYRQCIPYEGNEHLLGKTGGCDSFYKTW